MVTNIFAQNIEPNDLEVIVQINSFIEYILLYKSCPKIAIYILNKYPDEKVPLFKLLEKEIQIHLKNNPINYELVCDILNIDPKRDIKDRLEMLKGTENMKEKPIDNVIEKISQKEYYYSLVEEMQKKRVFNGEFPQNDEIHYLCDISKNNRLELLPGENDNFATIGYGNDIFGSTYKLKYDIPNFKNIIPNNRECMFIN